MMESYYAGWGWVIWYGLFLLFFFNMGNWGYTYKAHRRLADGSGSKNALYILNDRYARGDIKQDEYLRIKSDITVDNISGDLVTS